MDIILFAIIGSEIDASVLYWVCYGVYCGIRVFKAVMETIAEKL